MFSGSVLRLFLVGAALSAAGVDVAAADTTNTPQVRGGAGRRLADLTHVPVVGGVTTNSAKIQFRTDAASSSVVVQYSTDMNNLSSNSDTVSTARGQDFTNTVALADLDVNKKYYYQIVVDGAIYPEGDPFEFSTLPGTGTTCELAIFADVSSNDFPAPVYGFGKDNGANLALQIGDLNHGTPFNPKKGKNSARNMHKLMRDPSTAHGSDLASNILTKMGLVHMFDDHDFCGNDSAGQTCSKLDGIMEAFKEYYPSYAFQGDETGSDGVNIAQKFACGDAEVFVLDTRTQRPSEAADVAEAETVGRSMLGSQQLAWLQNGLTASTATFKIIISTVTASVDARDGVAFDNWAGFVEESQIMHDFLNDDANPIDNVVMVSADIHTGGGIDDGRNNRWGIPEMTVSHTNLPESAANDGRMGTWSEGVTQGSTGGGGYSLITVDTDTLRLRNMGNESAADVRHEYTMTDGDTRFTQGLGAELLSTIAKFEDQFGADPAMKAKFVRLGFHDAVGGPDGCIDDGPDNAGLNIPIDALKSIVDEKVDLSRADIWAAAALWAAGSSQDKRSGATPLVDYGIEYMHTGRLDCEEFGESIDGDGFGYGGKIQHLPSADLDTHGLLSFFLDEFGFDDQDTVVIMGAHTLGKLAPEHSGFNSGEHGWVLDNSLDTLDNTYYKVLVGPSPTTDPDVVANMTAEEKLMDGLDWDIVPAMDNDNFTTGKFEWEHFASGKRTIMTNADIALARNVSGTDPLTGENYKNEEGDVSCIWKCKRANDNCRQTRCPGAMATLEWMDKYQKDNEQFVIDFRDTFARMLKNRYTDDPDCDVEPCNLIRDCFDSGETCAADGQCCSGECKGDQGCA